MKEVARPAGVKRRPRPRWLLEAADEVDTMDEQIARLLQVTNAAWRALGAIRRRNLDEAEALLKEAFRG